MKLKITLSLLLLTLSFSSLSENNWKNFFNINIFSENSTSQKTYYYPNGKIKSKQFFLKDKRSGIWEYYYENGALKSKITFSQNFFNQESGIAVNYDPNGTILSEGKFINGNMSSVWNYYDENGRKIYSLDHSTGAIIVFNENEEAIFALSEEELADKMFEIQREIKNDRFNSTKN